MKLREKQAKFLINDAKLVIYASEVLKSPIICLEYFRTKEQQAIYVAKKLSKTMNSKHIDGLAKDYVFLADLMDDGKMNYTAKQYKPLGEYWESLGEEWGGRFGDDPNTEAIEGWDASHFQHKNDEN